MYIKTLLKIVEKVFYEFYDDNPLEIEKINDLKYKLIFKNESIIVDNLIGTKYTITFDKYIGTIDKFRDKFDDILGYVLYCCDTSNFIDLTTLFINKFKEYYKI